MEAPARTYGSCVGNVGIVGNPEGNRQCLERCSRSGFLFAEAGTGLPPFPAPLSPLAASLLRFAPDRFLLTKPNTLPHNRVASVATLRWCSGSSRNAVRLPFGMSVQLRRNPHAATRAPSAARHSPQSESIIAPTNDVNIQGRGLQFLL